MRIGILTGGGDCPGLNAVIRAVTKSLIQRCGAEVIGIEDGYLGLIERRVRPLSWDDVSSILAVGGTILGTSNKATPFSWQGRDHSVACAEYVRDLQLEARDKGRPWEFGKSFALSAPIGSLHRAQDIGHPSAAEITLTVNGQPRQSSDIAKLIWSVSECVAYLSEYEALEPGDIIMTGTPEGVNAVVAGDVMRGEVQGLGAIEVRVTG